MEKILQGIYEVIVGGFKSSWKYACQIGSSPQVGVKMKKC